MPTIIWGTRQLLELFFITWLFQECSSDQSSSHKSSSRWSPVSMRLCSVLPRSIPAITPLSPKPSQPPAIPWASHAPAALHSSCLEAWQTCGTISTHHAVGTHHLIADFSQVEHFQASPEKLWSYLHRNRTKRASLQLYIECWLCIYMRKQPEEVTYQSFCSLLCPCSVLLIEFLFVPLQMVSAPVDSAHHRYW